MQAYEPAAPEARPSPTPAPATLAAPSAPVWLGALAAAWHGGDGGETYWGGDGRDRLFGEGGDDQLYGGYGSDTLIGGDGDDRLSDGGYFPDRKGGDLLQGRGGDDSLSGASGDTVLGGSGWDTFLVNGRWEDPTKPMKLDFSSLIGGSGTAAGITFDRMEALNISTGTGDVSYVRDANIRTGDLQATIHGSGGNERFEGGTGDDLFYADFGEDTLIGGGGDDFLDIGYASAADVARGGEGYDTARLTLYAASGESFDLDLTGFDGSGRVGGVKLLDVEGVSLWLGSGADKVVAGDLGFSLYGREGNDSLYGGAGDDWLAGGGGDNLLVGAEGFDTASFSDAGAVNIDLRVRTAQPGMSGQNILKGIEGLLGSYFYGDTLTGGREDNVLNGWGGDDQVSGLGGRDTLTAGFGRDTLSGGGGRDRFVVDPEGSYIGESVAVDISDLRAGERVDLRALHSRLVAGFSGAAGEATLAYDGAGDRTLLTIDRDGDGAGDFQVVIEHGDWTSYEGLLW